MLHFGKEEGKNYKIRYDEICTHLRYSTFKKLDTKQHKTDPYLSLNMNRKIYFYCRIKGCKPILENWPDRLIKKRDKICLVMDVAIPSDRKVIKN
jgi:hypothetical protein